VGGAERTVRYFLNGRGGGLLGINLVNAGVGKKKMLALWREDESSQQGKEIGAPMRAR